MSEVKNFRIEAVYRMAKRVFRVCKEVRALTLEEALDKFFSEIGRQKLKRTQLRITKIEEIKPEALKNPKLKKLALLENPVIYVED